MAIRWVRRVFHAGWERNVVVTGVSQFFSIMGFAFALPFAPFYMQEQLGVTDPARLKFWVAMFGAATPLSLAVFSPLWGHLADRYSRRLMLLRANFAGAAVILLMGLVRSVEALCVLRLLQGMFTGTMTAAQTMVSVQAPAHRSGQALGALTAAVFSGSLTGAFVGGVVADGLGYRAAFLVGGAFLLASGLLVALWTTEDAPGAPRAEDGRTAEGRLAGQGILPVLLLFGLLSFVRQFDVSFLPLLVQEIHGGLAGAAIRTGALNAAGGIAGLLAALVVGRVADRSTPARLALLLTLGAGLLMAPQAWTRTFVFLFPVRFAMVFCTGALDPVMQIWLTRITPVRRRGAVFGWAGTMRSIGWFMAPLGSGLVAAHYGIRGIFVAGGLLFMLVLPAIRWAERSRPEPTEPRPTT
ncbi:MAG: MFS transporter [Kiritimatiellae bacterium]|nr:MFS transporter [Kiritimatiellia bacterium]